MAQLSGGTTIGGYEAAHAGNMRAVINNSLYQDPLELGYYDTSASGTGDLIIPLGKHRTGTSLMIHVQSYGGWSESGVTYHLIKGWGVGDLPKVVSTLPNDTDTRIEFYWYGADGYMYLFCKWINTSPSKSANNDVYIRVFHTASVTLTDFGSFASATNKIVPITGPVMRDASNGSRYEIGVSSGLVFIRPV